jgi:hypothetical protein
MDHWIGYALIKLAVMDPDHRQYGYGASSYETGKNLHCSTLNLIPDLKEIFLHHCGHV